MYIYICCPRWRDQLHVSIILLQRLCVYCFIMNYLWLGNHALFKIKIFGGGLGKITLAYNFVYHIPFWLNLMFCYFSVWLSPTLMQYSFCMYDSWPLCLTSLTPMFDLSNPYVWPLYPLCYISTDITSRIKMHSNHPCLMKSCNPQNRWQ